MTGSPFATALASLEVAPEDQPPIVAWIEGGRVVSVVAPGADAAALAERLVGSLICAINEGPQLLGTTG